jgi:hypothetical protein
MWLEYVSRAVRLPSGAVRGRQSSNVGRFPVEKRVQQRAKILVRQPVARMTAICV